MANANSKRNGTSVAAVAYYRMSTNRQEASIADQRAAVERFAKANGYHILREYVDEGISGDKTEKRVAFQEMIRHANGGEFKAILCWDQARFGRFDSVEAGYWIHPLRKAGVCLVTLDDGRVDWSDFTSRMMSAIKQEGKNQYLIDLSKDVTRGMTALAVQGKWPGGKPPIGYVVTDGELHIGPHADVEFVRWLFKSYKAGKSLRGIASEIGQPSPKGTQWTATGLSGVLKNPVYVGDLVWNRRCPSKYKRQGRPEKENARADWIVHKNNHEAIIDRDEFNAVQSRFAKGKRQTTPHKNGGKFVLSGLLVCGKCGHRLAGDGANGVQSYTCGGYREKGADFCDRNDVKQDEMLSIIMDELEAKYFNRDTMQRLRDECRRQVDERTIRDSSASVRKQVADIDAKLVKVKRRLVEVDADMLGHVQEHIRELQDQRDALTATLLQAGRTKREKRQDADDAVEAAMSLFTRLQDAVAKADPTLIREFLRQAVEKIKVTTKAERWTAKRFKHRIDHGIIYLKSNNLSATDR